MRGNDLEIKIAKLGEHMNVKKFIIFIFNYEGLSDYRIWQLIINLFAIFSLSICNNLVLWCIV